MGLKDYVEFGSAVTSPETPDEEVALSPFLDLRLDGSYSWVGENQVELQAGAAQISGGLNPPGNIGFTVASGWTVDVTIGCAIPYVFTNDNTAAFLPWNRVARGLTLNSLGSARRSTLKVRLYAGSTVVIMAGGQVGSTWGYGPRRFVLGTYENTLHQLGLAGKSLPFTVGADNARPCAQVVATYPEGNQDDPDYTSQVFQALPFSNWSLTLDSAKMEGPSNDAVEFEPPYGGLILYAEGYDLDGRAFRIDYRAQGDGLYSVYVDGLLERSDLTITEAGAAMRAFYDALTNRRSDPNPPPRPIIPPIEVPGVSLAALAFGAGVLLALRGGGSA